MFASLANLYMASSKPLGRFAKLCATLLEARFLQLVANYTIFTLKSSTSFVTIGIYVDDIIICSNDYYVISSITFKGS